MLPPKLARIMVNLSSAPLQGKILDPFCGSGTVLQEAWLRGYRNIEGSDLSEKAVADSVKNVAWLKARVPVFGRDAADLGKKVLPNTIDAIVTEPELGPPIPIRTERELHRRVDGLTMLYRRFLKSAAPLLAPRGRIVMAWPVFHLGQSVQFLTTRDVVPPELHVVWPFHQWLPRTARQTLVYERPGQIVGREVVLLEKRVAPPRTEQSFKGRDWSHRRTETRSRPPMRSRSRR
jgi:tRNA G10  N-methylase Trm11